MQPRTFRQAQTVEGHTMAAMALKFCVKGRGEQTNAAIPVAVAYGLEN